MAFLRLFKCALCKFKFRDFLSPQIIKFWNFPSIKSWFFTFQLGKFDFLKTFQVSKFGFWNFTSIPNFNASKIEILPGHCGPRVHQHKTYLHAMIANAVSRVIRVIKTSVVLSFFTFWPRSVENIDLMLFVWHVKEWVHHFGAAWSKKDDATWPMFSYTNESKL